MRYLLDTHTFLWFINGESKLSPTARKVILDPLTTKYVSIASFWEIAVKYNIGKLELNMSFNDLMYHITINGFTVLPINFADTLLVSSLELHHKDPFDRMIIAQAINENMEVISTDENFRKYENLKVIW